MMKSNEHLNKNTSNSTICAVVILILLFAWRTSCLAVGNTNEVWLSASNSASSFGTSNKFGLGTLVSPYYGDFYFIVKNLDPNTTVHLLPGTFWTAGQPGDGVTPVMLKTGQRLQGAGMYQTTLYLNAVSADTYDYDGLLATADGVEVLDLTLDCGASGSESFKRNGIHLAGSNSAVRRSRVINAVGNGEKESFIIIIGGPGKNGNLVEDCLVEQVLGNYANGIVAQGSAIARNNTIILPAVTCSSGAASHRIAGFNIGPATDCILDGNIVRNGLTGLYSENEPLSNVKLVNNTFTNVWNGIYITTSTTKVDNVLVLGNTIELNPNSDWETQCATLGITFFNNTTNSSLTMRNIKIGNNFVRANAQERSRAIISVGYGNNITNLVVHDNIFDPLSDFLLDGTFALNMHKNFDLSGASMHFRTFLAADSSPLYLESRDQFVRVNRTTSGTIVLPSSTNHSSKEVTIVNENTGTLTVSALSGDTISGTSTGTFRIFTSTGQGVWYAH